jgi:hypothetical protein
MDRAYEAVYPFGVPGVPLLILWVKFSPGDGVLHLPLGLTGRVIARVFY